MVFSRYNQQHVARILFAALFSLTLLPAVQATTQAPAAPAPEVTSVYKQLACYHLPSLAQAEADEIAFEQAITKSNTDAMSIEKRPLHQTFTIQTPKIGDVEKVRILYNILAAHDKETQSIIPTATIDKNVVEDMRLFCGEQNNLTEHLFGKINRTLTSVGSIELQRMLAQPTTDIAELQQRQNVVKALVSDEALFNALHQELEEIKAGENNLVWFWKQATQELELFFDQVYIQGNDANAISTWNKNTTAMQLWHNMQTLGAPTKTLLGPALGVLFTGIIIYCQLEFQVPFNTCISAAFDQYTLQTPNISTFMYALAAMNMLVFTVNLYQYTNQAIALNNIADNIHGHVMPAGSYAQTIDTMLATISASSVLQQAFPEHKELIAFNHAANEETQSLIEALKTDTFKGDPSFFSLRGRALSSFKKMFNGKNHFVKSMKTIGKLDAYMSIAKLYKEHANNPNARYSFVSYETATTTPHLNATNFWVPTLDANKVVTNSIEMGGTTPRNIIVTGPNAGGKSTALKGVIDAIIMAQTLGIAPVSEMSLTPFTIIKSYMNIADTTGSASLFQAEMRRAHNLLTSIKALNPHEFAFVIMDEIFTGTNHREGQAGAMGVVQGITKDAKCACFFATHFKKLTDLEAAMPGVIRNCKVTVTKNADGSFTFPYKLASGITDQAIALDLLAQEGFDADVLAAAQAALD